MCVGGLSKNAGHTGLQSRRHSFLICNVCSLVHEPHRCSSGMSGVLRNDHKFEIICKHLFPYFSENYNFSSQVPSLVRRRHQDGTRSMGCCTCTLRVRGRKGLTLAGKGDRETEGIVAALGTRGTLWAREPVKPPAS